MGSLRYGENSGLVRISMQIPPSNALLNALSVAQVQAPAARPIAPVTPNAPVSGVHQNGAMAAAAKALAARGNPLPQAPGSLPTEAPSGNLPRGSIINLVV